MNSKSKATDSIRLYRTAPHPCCYKTGEQAATVFVDPELIIDQQLNSKLSQLGYRRSGAHLYRPDCDNCQACISCRVPVDKFQLHRRFRKILRKNQDISVCRTKELDNTEAYSLYKRYIDTRHRDGDMYPASPEQFDAFIRTNTVNSHFFKFYKQNELVAVSVVDVLERSLSAVYTFFDPDLPKRSLGKLVILWQIKQAQRLKMDYLYLGYWIRDCQKMQYKNEFRPIEMLIDGRWLLLK